MTIQFANNGDLNAIRSLLEQCDLPANDLEQHLNHFLVAKLEDRVIGCIGMELKGPLLRSLAVDPRHRGLGVAKQLCDRLLAHAKDQGMEEIYLLTTTASGFFSKAGFERRDRDEAPETIRNHKQFTELCPSSAVLMSIRF